MYSFVYFRDHKSVTIMYFTNTWTRVISSLSYIELKRLDNDIKTKSISKTCTNYETKGKPREKKATSRYRTRHRNKNSVCMERNISTPITTRPHCRRYHKCYNLYNKWTGQVGCEKTTTRNFVKLQKYAFLKQNNFMHIDELPFPLFPFL